MQIPLPEVDRRLVVYQLAGTDEILLSDEECPLDIAVSGHRNVTFEVKMALRKISSEESISSSSSSHRKALSDFFGVKEKELAVPFSSFIEKKIGGSENDIRMSDDLSLHTTCSNGSSNSFSEGLNKLKKSGTGIWLKDKAPAFRRKGNLQPCYSDQDLMMVGRHASKRRTKTKRITALLGNNQKKKHTDSKRGSSDRGSVSSQDDGLFKLYANFPESEYACRRVFVDKLSKAEDIVRDFLDLSSVSYDSYKDYVLCDVIGWYHSLSNASTGFTDSKFRRRPSVGWKEESFRTLDDKENPLVVQSLWVPSNGRSRRFEIRRKTALKEDQGDLTFFDLVNGDIEQLPSSSNTSVIIRWDQLSDENGRHEYEVLANHPIITELTAEKEETESSDESAVNNIKLMPPWNRPYLICIQGYSVEKDLMCHVLGKETLVVGNQLRTEETPNKAPDIYLHDPDILLHHCILTCHQVNDLNASKLIFDQFVVTIEPCGGGKVSLNGYQLDQEIELRPGDLISIGNYYHFIFRDASSKFQTLFGIRWMNSISDPGKDSIYSEFPHLSDQVQNYEEDKKRWKVAYKLEHEDNLVEFMTSLIKGEEGYFGLACGHLCLMIIEFAAYTHGPEHTRTMLIRVASALLAMAENKAKEMASTQSQSLTSKPSMDSLIPDLRVLLVSLSNSLELLNCLQVKLPDYLPTPDKDGEQQGWTGPSEGYQEVLAVLEEVVMYSFQQCVYYITKTLYNVLPYILSANPFAEIEEAAEPTGVAEITHIFQVTFDLLQEVQIDSVIISQLYAYLLFFMNAALFNVLLEKGANGKYLRWSKGVQIRGNLDKVESWILDKGLEEQMSFLQSISAAADLLATPKIQLMQATWSSLRNDFASLRPAQLHQLLSKYEINKSVKTPTGWSPIGEDVELVKQRELILERFEDHPPLTLPSESSQLDLCAFHHLPTFQCFLDHLRKSLPFVQVYQGASRVGFRRQIKTTESSHSLSPKRQEGEPVTKLEPIYSVVKFKTKDHNHNEHNHNERNQNMNCRSPRHPPPETPPKKIVEKKQGFSSMVRSKKSYKKHKNRNKNSSLTKKADQKNEMLDMFLPVASEGEASNLVQAYFSGVSSGHFDSIPEEDNESSGVEDFPLLDEVRFSDSFEDNQMSAMGKDCQSSGSDFSWSTKEDEYHDSAVEDFDQVKYAAGSKKNNSGKSDDSNKPGKIPPRTTSLDDVFVVDLVPEKGQLGIRFADGMKTPLATPGVYIRGFVQKSAAASCGRLRIGDRVLAVDGTSLIAFEYDQAMDFIKKSRERYRLLVSRSEPELVLRLTAPITPI